MKIDLKNLKDFEEKRIKLILNELNIDEEDFITRDEFTDKEKGKVLLALIKKGVNFNSIFKFLDWKGFEIIVASTFDDLGYSVLSNFRFKDEITKYEVDVIAYKYPFLFLIDCKHYKTPSPSIMKNAVIKQKERTEVLIEVFPIISQEIVSKLLIPLKREIYLYPLIISWKDHNIHFYDEVPIVPFNNLQGFLKELDEYRFNLFHLPITLT